MFEKAEAFEHSSNVRKAKRVWKSMRYKEMKVKKSVWYSAFRDRSRE